MVHYKLSIKKGRETTGITKLTLLIFQERDELVRKGILTPFHKLNGFERRLQELGPSQRRNIPAEQHRSNDFASASVARAVQSISEAAQARPSTKLLDPEALPKLNPPTYPFKRLKKPLKIPQSLENDTHKNKSSRLRRKRPLPDKRWRKLSNLEEKHVHENGMFNVVLDSGVK